VQWRRLDVVVALDVRDREHHDDQTARGQRNDGDKGDKGHGLSVSGATVVHQLLSGREGFELQEISMSCAPGRRAPSRAHRRKAGVGKRPLDSRPALANRLIDFPP